MDTWSPRRTIGSIRYINGHGENHIRSYFVCRVMTRTEIGSIIGFDDVVERREKFPKCPRCGRVEENIVYDPAFICSECDQTYSTHEEFVERPVRYAVCSYCQDQKRLERDDQGTPLLFCLECGNLIAVEIGERFAEPLDVLAIDSRDTQGCVVAETTEQLLAARILAGIAARQGQRFGFRDDLRYLLCHRDNRYYGYLSWLPGDGDNRPVFVQLWVDPRYRETSMATDLLESWCTREISEYNGFEIVTPTQEGRDFFESHDDDGTVFGKTYEMVGTATD